MDSPTLLQPVNPLPTIMITIDIVLDSSSMGFALELLPLVDIFLVDFFHNLSALFSLFFCFFWYANYFFFFHLGYLLLNYNSLLNFLYNLALYFP